MQTIQLHKHNKLATITFNRPQAMNSLNEAMAEELEHTFSELKSDTDTRVIILTGAGKLFMAGGDISYFYQNLHSLSQSVRKIIGQVHAVITSMNESDKIVIASVHGSVAGVGLSFMLASDLVIAAENTKFTTAYSKIGTSTDGGLTYFLPRAMGSKKAMEIALLANIFSAETAMHWGLVNWVVAQEQLAAETERLAQRLAKGPKEAFSNIKKLLNQSYQNNLPTQLKLEEEFFVKATQTENFRRGVTAFINKSEAEFI